MALRVVAARALCAHCVATRRRLLQSLRFGVGVASRPPVRACVCVHARASVFFFSGHGCCRKCQVFFKEVGRPGYSNLRPAVNKPSRHQHTFVPPVPAPRFRPPVPAPPPQQPAPHFLGGSAEYGVPPYKNKAAIFVSLLSGNV